MAGGQKTASGAGVVRRLAVYRRGGVLLREGVALQVSDSTVIRWKRVAESPWAEWAAEVIAAAQAPPRKIEVVPALKMTQSEWQPRRTHRLLASCRL